MQSPNTTINLYTWHKSRNPFFAGPAGLSWIFRAIAPRISGKQSGDLISWYGLGQDCWSLVIQFAYESNSMEVFLDQMWKFRRETPPFFPSKKSGLQKSYLMMVVLVGRSSKKNLEIVTPLRCCPLWLCGHFFCQPTSTVVTCLLALQHLAKTHLRCLAGPAKKQTIGRSCCMQQASTNGFKKWLLPHVAYHFPHYWWCLWCYCGTNNLNSDPSKTDKQTNKQTNKQAITLETILRSMFSTHGTCQSLSGLKCREVEHQHHPHHQQQHHKHHHDASKSIGPFQETDYVVKSVYRTFV